MQNHKCPPSSLIFIFGGSGDLNLRKLTPALYNLFLDEWMPEKFGIVGIGRSEYSDDKYRARKSPALLFVEEVKTGGKKAGNIGGKI